MFGCGGAPPSILHVKQESVRMRLLNARSGAAIANADITLESDAGDRCIRAPCPSTSTDWTGRSDARGEVIVRTRALRATTIISSPTAWANLVERSEQNADGTWTVELDPGPDSSTRFLYGLKLVDRRAGRPIANTGVRIEFPSGTSFEGQTNSLGYLFFPVAGPAYGGDYGVAVSGYRRAEIPGGWREHYAVALDTR
jgi:hypothetical protein